jgi:ribonuclease HI
LINMAVKKDKVPVEPALPEEAKHGVFYTDGGCKPNPGIGGYGVHGYTYLESVPKQGTGCKKALPTRTGYAMGKSGIPDITIVQYVDAIGSMVPTATNNSAELMALTKCFEVIDHLNLEHAHVLLDSQYVRKGINDYVVKWEANNWIKHDGQPVANDIYWKHLLKTKRSLEAKGVELAYAWVEGHSGNLGNDLADELAGKGIAAGRNDLQLSETLYSDAKGYWNTEKEIDRLFSQPNWYFNSKQGAFSTELQRWVYHLGAPREDDELLGKKMVDASFCVLQMVEPQPVLEMIRKAHARADFLHYGSPVLGRLTDIFSKDTLEDLIRFGDKLLRLDYHNGALYAPDRNDPMGRLLTRDLRPARLAFGAMDSLYALEGALNHHVRGNVGVNQVSTDITALLYESTVVGKRNVNKLKAAITQTERAFPVKVSYKKADGSLGTVSLKLTFGHDLPDRNTFAAIADHEPQVSVLVWPESPVAVRYATVVETTTGRGIWSAIYSNVHLITA